MQLNVNVLKVDGPFQKPGKNGVYQQIDVAYMSDGKASVKKLMSFTKPEVFATFKDASPGDNFVVESVKEGDYWQWVKATKESTGGPAVQPQAASAKPASGGQWETREERSMRQRSIQRQNALGNAIALLKTEKGVPAVSEVLAVAEQFEMWIVRKDAVKELEEMKDDIPWHEDAA